MCYFFIIISQEIYNQYVKREKLVYLTYRNVCLDSVLFCGEFTLHEKKNVALNPSKVTSNHGQHNAQILL
jgi:hypothetical protein